MKILTLLFLTILFSNYLSAQTIFRGKLIDNENKNPVSYATISANGYGTISNELGEFNLVLDTLPEDITISHISYQQISVNLTSEKDTFIFLDTKTIVLKSVTVRDLNPFIEMVVENLKKKSILKQSANALYKMNTSVDEDVYEIQEMFWSVNFSTKGINAMKIEQARYASKKAEKGDFFLSLANFSDFTLFFQLYQDKEKTNINVFPLNENFDKYYNYELMKIINEGKKDEILVISFTKKMEIDRYAFEGYIVEGEFYIEKNTFNVIKSECKIEDERLAPTTFDENDSRNNSALKNNVKLNNSFITFDASYKYDRDVFYIDYIKADFHLLGHFPNGVYRKIHGHSILIFYEFSSKIIGKKYTQLSSGVNDIIKMNKAGYNKKFWKDNPIVKRTPIEEEIIEEFERVGYFGNLIEDKK